MATAELNLLPIVAFQSIPTDTLQTNTLLQGFEKNLSNTVCSNFPYQLISELSVKGTVNIELLIDANGQNVAIRGIGSNKLNCQSVRERSLIKKK